MPPGIPFLVQLAPTLFGPPVIAYAVIHLLDSKDVFRFETSWVKTLIYVFATPFYLYLKSVWLTLSIRRQAWQRGARLLPRYGGRLPGGVDILFNLIKALRSEYVADALNGIFEEHGKTIQLELTGGIRIMTTEPRYIKHILAGNFSNYVKGEQLFGAATRSVLGTGVFNADGDLWKFHRTLARPFFSRDRISDFQIFETHAQEVLQKMKESFRSGKPVDFQDVSARFTLDSATEFLFGDCVHSIYEPFLLPGGIQPTLSGSDTPTLAAHQPSSSAFVRAFGTAQEIIGRRIRIGDVWPAFETFKDNTDEPTRKIRAYLQPIVDRGVARKRMLRESQGLDAKEHHGEKTELQEGMTFLDYLMLETEDAEIIRDSLMNMLIAGRDTTACLLTFATYALSQHPDVLAKLRDEIHSVVGQDKVPTYDDIREMKYLRAVLNETLRLWPPVPMNYRETVEADVWTGPDNTRYFIPAKTATGYSVLMMHRDKSLWGDDALDFDPMRWIDDRLARLTANPFAFLPFNAGPRICLGQQFAYNESSFFLVRLLQTFSTITLRPDAQPAGTLPNFKGDWDLSRGRNAREKVWPRSHLTMYVEGGMWLVMREAEASEVA